MSFPISYIDMLMVFQCAFPVFDGLLDPQNNIIILDLVRGVRALDQVEFQGGYQR